MKIKRCNIATCMDIIYITLLAGQLTRTFVVLLGPPRYCDFVTVYLTYNLKTFTTEATEAVHCSGEKETHPDWASSLWSLIQLIRGAVLLN